MLTLRNLPQLPPIHESYLAIYATGDRTRSKRACGNRLLRRRVGPEVKNKMAETKEQRTVVVGGGLANGEGQMGLTLPSDALLFPPFCCTLPVRLCSEVPYFE